MPFIYLYHMFDKSKGWGCNKFPDNSEEKDFCQLASKKIKFKYKKIKDLLRAVADSVIMDVNSDISKKIKFVKEDDEYFSENLKLLTKLEEKLAPLCDRNEETFRIFKYELASKFVILKEINKKFVWDEMSMLETNYSALAYVLTRLREKDKSKDSFEYSFRRYFEGVHMEHLPANKQDLTAFQKLVLNYLAESLDDMDNEIIGDVLHTIKSTYRIGASAEQDAYRELKKNFDIVIKFSGDFSFADALGVDFLIYDEEYKWIPVQVKNNFSKCYRNTKFCNNVCMGKENYKWRIETYLD